MPSYLTPSQVVQGLRRAWFPVARSADLARPQAALLLGEHLVVFRGADGSPAITQRYCIHRGGDLSLGDVIAGRIECPYHGWCYQPDGTCDLIPSLGPDGRVPPNARIKAYPVKEHYGLVWTCLDDPVADVPTLPELQPLNMTFLADPAVESSCGLLNAIENFRDVAHFPFVHRRSMGEVKREVEPLDVRRDGFDTWMSRNYEAQSGESGVYTDLPEMTHNYHTVVPALVSNRLDYGPQGQRIVIEAFQPYGETGCRIFVVSGTAEDYTASSPEEALQAESGILAEDLPIMDTVWPKEVPLANEVHRISVRSDRYTLATRQAYISFIEQALAMDSTEPGMGDGHDGQLVRT